MNCVFQELDMNSCFVTNAAAIAKRKQKAKQDKKERKVENLKYVPEANETVDFQNEVKFFL